MTIELSKLLQRRKVSLKRFLETQDLKSLEVLLNWAKNNSVEVSEDTIQQINHLFAEMRVLERFENAGPPPTSILLGGGLEKSVENPVEEDSMVEATDSTESSIEPAEGQQKQGKSKRKTSAAV